MVSLEEYLLTCSKKTFKSLYLDSLEAGSEDFAKYERARCIRHLSIYNLITSDHKNTKNKCKDYLHLRENML